MTSGHTGLILNVEFYLSVYKLNHFTLLICIAPFTSKIVYRCEVVKAPRVLTEWQFLLLSCMHSLQKSSPFQSAFLKIWFSLLNHLIQSCKNDSDLQMMGLILCQRPEEALICCVTCSSLMVQKLCHVFTDSWSPSSIARFAFIRGFSPDLTNKRPYLSAIPTSIQSILNTHIPSA